MKSTTHLRVVLSMLVGVLGAGSIAFGMDPEDSFMMKRNEELSDQYKDTLGPWQEGSSKFADKTVSAVKHGFDQVATQVKLAVQEYSELQQASLKKSEKTVVSNENTIVEEKNQQQESVQTEVVVVKQDESENSQTVNNNESELSVIPGTDLSRLQEIGASVQALCTREAAIKFGIGAVALVTVGGVTYVLYKNGTLKKLADACKEHPYIAGGSIATGLSVVAGSLVAYYYYGSSTINERKSIINFLKQNTFC